ncbi:Tat (twin-arginine translocation) pathway signal sequence [Nonomuraea solani]|uniref:Cytochrome bc1 complex Rieske iron-sulfur subunit n=1 Tax=Nonomuraea solani TaxID=1144553 RepID=A0A1H5UEF2_9ACTN|nr:Rieske (2Fe-2S) protein [Nonomuraea solani]SEF72848.1 Tat (twin-arginine translocation) pathway signal sequence [Nonomuraea solani]
MLTRRTLITRGGAAGAGVVFLWPRPAEAAETAETAGPALAKARSIPVGGGKVVKGKYVITQPKKGVYRCFSAKCTHQGCTVASVSGGTINCPCHGSKFSASTGAVVRGPAKRALTRKKIKVAKGVISLA